MINISPIDANNCFELMGESKGKIYQFETYKIAIKERAKMIKHLKDKGFKISQS